jgi:hypothetical protein
MLSIAPRQPPRIPSHAAHHHGKLQSDKGVGHVGYYVDELKLAVQASELARVFRFAYSCEGPPYENSRLATASAQHKIKEQIKTAIECE